MKKFVVYALTAAIALTVATPAFAARKHHKKHHKKHHRTTARARQ